MYLSPSSSFILLAAPAYWTMYNEFGKATESLQLFGKCWVVNNNEQASERERVRRKMLENEWMKGSLSFFPPLTRTVPLLALKWNTQREREEGRKENLPSKWNHSPSQINSPWVRTRVSERAQREREKYENEVREWKTFSSNQFLLY